MTMDNLAEILKPTKNLMQFMETRDTAFLHDVFAPQKVLLIDSFFPYVFEGEGAALNWAKGFVAHAQKLTELKHHFGEPQEQSVHGDIAFVSLPTTWHGLSGQKRFHETGALALVLVKFNQQWKIQNYSWGAASYMELPQE